MIRPAPWFITGVGTDAGKTVVTAALAAALTRAGIRCRILKPVQTGCELSPDGDYLAPDVTAYRIAAPDAEAEALLCFAAPCSPPLAARLEGKVIAATELLDLIRARLDDKETTLIEAAGGVLTPLAEGYSVADCAADLGARIILVVDNRLGAINACLLSLEALRARSVPVEAIVVNHPFSAPGPDVERDAELDQAIREDNIRAIRQAAPDASMYLLPHIEKLSSHTPSRGVAEEHLRPLARRIAGTGRPTPAAANAPSILDFDRHHLWHPYAPTHPAPEVWEVASADGCRIRLADGRELIDGMSSWWAAIHGHRPPELLAALRRQAETLPHVMFGGLTHEPAAVLGKLLLRLAPAGLDRVFYTDSGSVAVEAALKMAIQYQHASGKPGKHRFLAPLGGYHGDTLGAMAVCDPENGMHHLFAGALPQNIFAGHFSCPVDGEFRPEHAVELENAFRRHGAEIAAAIAEPIVQGAGGMRFYHPEYLRLLRRLCDESGALLILDEIATGFGRTGTMFASELAGVIPDIMCVGKALTGGVMTLAAVLAADRVAETISREGVFMHGPTFMANPLACAVAVASLELLDQSPWRQNVLRIEAALRRGIEPCRIQPGVADVRTLGAIGVVEMKTPVNAPRLQRFFVDQGVWIRPFSRLIYIMPPYISGLAELDALTAAVRVAVETRQWA